MQGPVFDQPYKIISWQDKINTGAIGWIVIHNIVNGVTGGGLFMDESASLQEVTDLAYTMSLKNSLQQPIMGGGKGGIRFDPCHPGAKAVLRRFLHDNLEIITTHWCTGGDLNTTTQAITELLAEVSPLKSPFSCLATMLQTSFDFNVSHEEFDRRLHAVENKFFTVEQAVTGYSIVKTIEATVNSHKSKIIVQGFGKVGRAFCYYAHQHYPIVGICERDWFIYDPDGLDIKELLLTEQTAGSTDWQRFKPIYRSQWVSSEDFLLRFLAQAKADIFCPCATRYSITQKVLATLISVTFASSVANTAFIIAGANNVFSEKTLITQATMNHITVIPEWISNSGSAILFMEALKHQGCIDGWQTFIKEEIAHRIHIFINQARNIAHRQKLTVYQACIYLAARKLHLIKVI